MNWRFISQTIFFRNKKTNLVYLALGMVLIFSECKPFFRYPDNMKHIPEWWGSRKETVATVTEVYHQPETVFNYAYSVDGIVTESAYSFITRSNKGVVKGSKYMVVYNPENPKQHLFLLHKPHFEINEGVRYTEARFGNRKGKGGIITFKSTASAFGYNIIEFVASYEVNGVSYDRVSFFVLNDRNYVLEDLTGKKFTLTYWVKNPERSIIHLDEPILQ